MITLKDIRQPYNSLAAVLATLFLVASAWSLLTYGILANVAVQPEAGFPFLLVAACLFLCAIVWLVAFLGFIKFLDPIGDVVLLLALLIGICMCIYLVPTLS